MGIICASEDHLGSQVGSCIGEQEVSKVYSRKPAPNKLPSKQPLNAHTHVSLYRDLEITSSGSCVTEEEVCSLEITVQHRPWLRIRSLSSTPQSEHSTCGRFLLVPINAAPIALLAACHAMSQVCIR